MADASHPDLRQRQHISQHPQQPSNNAAAEVQNNKINIVLLGKTGVGKSSSGNTILGAELFKRGRSISSVTKTCSKNHCTIDDKDVSVIDTPGFFDTTLEEKELAKEIAYSVFLSKEGVHAFLFVLPFGRFTKQEAVILKQIQDIFGKEILKYVIILFTYGDDVGMVDLDLEMKKNEILCNTVGDFMRCHVFNNKDQRNRDQVIDLLQMIYSMVQQNGGLYTNEMYKLASMTSFERFCKILKDVWDAIVKYLNENSSFDCTIWKARCNDVFHSICKPSGYMSLSN
ncbi:GTPase IMAP family member 4-like [Misgurnus anguillicaudatus]|uniref:GTPase IMAP family member 4-like n=1 Tax=Misgurnus anguillicaudatus TaxID=75329 RepID=UPI003CCF27D2